MTDWQHELRAGDPFADGHQMDVSDARRIRAALVAVGVSQPQRQRPLSMVLAAGLVAVVAAGVWAVRRDDARQAAVGVNVDAQAAEPMSAERRQMQFSMPGGTRVIWFFDPSFEMR